MKKGARKKKPSRNRERERGREGGGAEALRVHWRAFSVGSKHWRGAPDSPRRRRRHICTRSLVPVGVGAPRQISSGADGSQKCVLQRQSDPRRGGGAWFRRLRMMSVRGGDENGDENGDDGDASVSESASVCGYASHAVQSPPPVPRITTAAAPHQAPPLMAR